MAGLAEKLKRRALDEGFDAVATAPARLPSEIAKGLGKFLDRDYHGDMRWLAETAQRRRAPEAMWPEARSAIMVALSYAPSRDPLKRLADRQTGVISVYALGRDYHELIKGKLRRLGQWFAKEAKAEVRIFVDTAPLMEKPLAALAGLGWQGKHTNLLSRQLGSWFFLGAILTDAELESDPPEGDHCGSCRACLDICPTQAFPAPHQLDARRCISYLTIEHKGHIQRQFRRAMGNRIFGCDDCLAVCPWNKFAVAAREAKLLPREDLLAPSLSGLLRLDDAGFRKKFSGSPVKRTGRDRFIRNVLIAAGNSGDTALIPQIETLLQDQSSLVRAMAVWALSQLDRRRLVVLRAGLRQQERDEAVQSEWDLA